MELLKRPTPSAKIYPLSRNYGMVPQTLLSKEAGGDGNPLGIILLGPPINHDEVATAKLIGALKLKDDGKQDDKLIAVQCITRNLYLVFELNWERGWK
ncbi:MAG: hypothetical protein HOJ79_03290 [Nitrospina sp.]|jgi:inorganic pyrophosphatase|nr:hypothetical protein [Nitrospina sp.]